MRPTPLSHDLDPWACLAICGCHSGSLMLASYHPPKQIKPPLFRQGGRHRRDTTKENRTRYDRTRLRYESDLTDAEWAEEEPLIPPAKPGGNKRSVDIRQVVNGVMYVLSTGCQWRAIPKDLPPRSTVHDYLERWTWDGTLERLHHALYVKCREQASREASPTAAVIDAQSVKSAEKGGPRSIRMGMMRGRRSRARSGTSWSIPRVCCYRPS